MNTKPNTPPPAAFIQSALFRAALLTSILASPLARSAEVDDLLGYWDFNDDANPGAVNPLSQTAPDVVLGGNATLTDDAGGFTGSGGDRGLDLGGHNDGSQAKTTAGDHFESLNGAAPYAISLWQFNRQQANTSTFWVHAPASSGNQRGIQAHIPWGNGTIFFDQSGCCAANAERLTVGGQIQLNTWQHFVFMKDADGNRTIWVDGVQAASAPGAAPLEPLDGIVTIGAEGPNNANSFNGIVDEFAIFSDVLDEDQIQALAAGASVPEILFTDEDMDGMDDNWELANGLDPNDESDAALDPDGDNLTNLQEYEKRTNPNNADTDNDGLNDDVETNTGTWVSAADTGTDPNESDTDGDGLPDGAETNTGTFVSASDAGSDPHDSDSDDDNFTDGSEVDAGSDPNDADSKPGVFWEVDFDNDDGAFTEEATGASPIPATYNAAEGTWSFEGDDSGPATNTLTSPEIVMPEAGGLQIFFRHRYSIEPTWDGTAVQVSRNGGSFRTVPTDAFVQNGYNFSGLIGNHVLQGGDGFNGDSPGYSEGEFILSIANFGGGDEGDTIQLRFLGAWDEGARGAGIPNWEIDFVGIGLRTDTDDDGIPDSYELGLFPGDLTKLGPGDLDGDGLNDAGEFYSGSDPNEADTDGDGLTDGEEIAAGSDPLLADTDGDGLTDEEEVNTHGTDPANPDTDGDGFSDGGEISAGTNPNSASSFPAVPVPIGYWSFDDQGAGGTTADLSGSGNDGIVNGNPEFVPGACGADGDFAIKFDGVDDFVDTEVSLINGLEEFTMAGWVKWDARQSGNRIGWFGQNDAVEYGLINPTTAHHWANVGGAYNVTVPDVNPEWTHFVVTGNANGRKAYVNGVDQGTMGSSIVGSGSAFTFKIGGGGVFDANGNWFTGCIDDVAVWDVVLSDDEIAQLADCTITPLGPRSKVQLRIFNVTHDPDADTTELTWESQEGQLFEVRKSLDLTGDPASEWPVVLAEVPAADAPAETTTAIVDTNATEAQAFYVVVQIPPPPVFEDDFETDQGWTTGANPGDAGDTTWERGAPSNVGPPTGADGSTNCFGTNLDADYGLNANIYLRSPVIDLTSPGITGVRLSFQQFKDIETGFDLGSVRVLRAGDLMQLGAPVADVIDGVTADWEQFSANLPPEALGEEIILEFQFTSDELESFAGWYIDNVVLEPR